jgi:hypothetical protein
MSDKIKRCAYCKKILEDDNQKAYCNSTCEELRKIKNKEYYEAHKAAVIKHNAEYAKAHPDLRRQISQTYRDKLTPEEIQAMNISRRTGKAAWARKNRRKRKRILSISVEQLIANEKEKAIRRALGIEVPEVEDELDES